MLKDLNSLEGPGACSPKISDVHFLRFINGEIQAENNYLVLLLACVYRKKSLYIFGVDILQLGGGGGGGEEANRIAGEGGTIASPVKKAGIVLGMCVKCRVLLGRIQKRNPY